MMRYSDMPKELKSEIRMYGCTVEQLRDVIAQDLYMNRTSGKAIATRLIESAKTELASGLVDDAVQTLNRAQWVLFNILE